MRFSFVLLLTLGACGFGTRDIAEHTPTQDACRAGEFQYLIGRSIRSTLDTRFQGETRYLGKGAVVAENGAATRMNILLSKDLPLPENDNIIVDVFCG